MGKSIKNLTYNVIRNDSIIQTGSVPAIIAVGGSNKDYDLGGIWLTHTSPEVTTLQLTGDNVNITLHSDSKKDDWLEYRKQNSL